MPRAPIPEHQRSRVRTVISRQNPDGTRFDEAVIMDATFCRSSNPREIRADAAGNWRGHAWPPAVPRLFAVTWRVFPPNPYSPALSQADWESHCLKTHPRFVETKCGTFLRRESFARIPGVTEVRELTAGVHQVLD